MQGTQKLVEDSATMTNKQNNIVNIKVLESSFVKSISNISQAPHVSHTEIAILGRSNVGKSTMINLLLNNKNLAKTSSTPGKTQLMNFFLSLWEYKSNKYTLRFIDFPGFGYAKVSKSLKNEWDKNLSHFLQKRESVKLFIHLIDSRHTELEIDKNINDFLYSVKRNDSTIMKVFTKCDKLNKNDITKLKKQNLNLLSNTNKQSVEYLRISILSALYAI